MANRHFSTSRPEGSTVPLSEPLPTPPPTKELPRDNRREPRAKTYVNVAELLARPTVIPRRSGYLIPEPRRWSKRELRLRSDRDSTGDKYQGRLTWHEGAALYVQAQRARAALLQLPGIDEEILGRLDNAADLEPVDRLRYVAELQGFLLRTEPENGADLAAFGRSAMEYMELRGRERDLLGVRRVKK